MHPKTPTTVAHLAHEYRELNGTHYDVLEQPPSALHFSRLVHISRPVLIKGAAIRATDKWTPDYLLAAMADREISVAVTPEGQGADALATGPDGTTYFAEPHVEKMPMRAFLARLGPPARDPAGEALYLQSQNGNLYPAAPSEFAPLLPDVPPHISWASDALAREPEAVNLWIGDSRSVTSVHCDPYENIYTVVRGTKHFTLFPPTEGYCLRERTFPHARYTRPTPSAPLALTPTPHPHPPVRWSSLRSPDAPRAPTGTAPLRIAVRAGEMLYLPPGWWHHVRQTGPLCVAVNWWYDMEMRGVMGVWLGFLRGEVGGEAEAEAEAGGGGGRVEGVSRQ